MMTHVPTLRSHSVSNPARFRRSSTRLLPAPRTLVVKRISELHRRLIDPASDLQTVTAAKRSLLRLLSDPMTLPVITTRSAAVSTLADGESGRQAQSGTAPRRLPSEPVRTRRNVRAPRLLRASSSRSRRLNALPRQRPAFLTTDALRSRGRISRS